MRIAVAGSSGFIGTRLVERLTERGDEVVRLVRREAEQPDERRWDPADGTISGPALGDVDAVVNLAGAGIAERPWTKGRREQLLASRLEPTTTLVSAIRASDRCRVFCSGSAVGYYGETGEHTIDEQHHRGEGFLPELCQAWEDAAAGSPARTTFLRTGLVLDPRGGLLAPQLPLFKMGLGGKVGDGRQWMPWISLDDHIRAVLHCLDTDVEGPVNLVGPAPVRNLEFTEALGEVLHRPTVVPVPVPLIKVGLGSEAVKELLLVSNRALPSVLTASGFRFTDRDLGECLRRLLHGEDDDSRD